MWRYNNIQDPFLQQPSSLEEMEHNTGNATLRYRNIPKKLRSKTIAANNSNDYVSNSNDNDNMDSSSNDGSSETSEDNMDHNNENENKNKSNNSGQKSQVYNDESDEITQERNELIEINSTFRQKFLIQMRHITRIVVKIPIIDNSYKYVEIQWNKGYNKYCENKNKIMSLVTQNCQEFMPLYEKLSILPNEALIGGMLVCSGLVLMFTSLPGQLQIGMICVAMGVGGILFVTYKTIKKFMDDRGIISLAPQNVLRTVLLQGSILDIFDEIRHSRFGIVDLLLSQLLPLSEAERDIIVERLPHKTQEIVNTQGLIYLTPQKFQNLVLPKHLRRDTQLSHLNSGLGGVYYPPHMDINTFDEATQAFSLPAPLGNNNNNPNARLTAATTTTQNNNNNQLASLVFNDNDNDNNNNNNNNVRQATFVADRSSQSVSSNESSNHSTKGSSSPSSLSIRSPVFGMDLNDDIDKENTRRIPNDITDQLANRFRHYSHIDRMSRINVNNNKNNNNNKNQNDGDNITGTRDTDVEDNDNRHVGIYSPSVSDRRSESDDSNDSESRRSDRSSHDGNMDDNDNNDNDNNAKTKKKKRGASLLTPEEQLMKDLVNGSHERVFRNSLSDTDDNDDDDMNDINAIFGDSGKNYYNNNNNNKGGRRNSVEYSSGSNTHSNESEEKQVNYLSSDDLQSPISQSHTKQDQKNKKSSTMIDTIKTTTNTKLPTSIAKINTKDLTQQQAQQKQQQQKSNDNSINGLVGATSTLVSPGDSSPHSVSMNREQIDPNTLDTVSLLQRGTNMLGGFIGGAMLGNVSGFTNNSNNSNGDGFGRSRIKGNSYKSPLLGAVIDSRVTEIGLKLLRYLWKKPFAKLSDNQLASIFALSVSGVAYFIIKSKHMRRTFVNTIKYSFVIAAFWIAIFTFIELIARKKTDYIHKIIEMVKHRYLLSGEKHEALRQIKRAKKLLATQSAAALSRMRLNTKYQPEFLKKSTYIDVNTPRDTTISSSNDNSSANSIDNNKNNINNDTTTSNNNMGNKSMNQIGGRLLNRNNNINKNTINSKTTSLLMSPNQRKMATLSIQKENIITATISGNDKTITQKIDTKNNKRNSLPKSQSLLGNN